MDDLELVTYVDGRIGECVNLSEQRKQQMEYYLGKPFGNEVEGRSQAMLTDVADTVEWILPSLMDIFTSSDEYVVFEPVGPEDEDAADQESQMVNHTFTKDNNGFMVMYGWFKDALISRVGYVKTYWEETEKYQTERYDSLPEASVAILSTSPEVDIVEQTDNQDGTFSVVVKEKRVNGKVCVINCPPEEILVPRGHMALSLKDADFVAHKTQKTISWLREQGYDVDDDIQDEGSSNFSVERNARIGAGPQQFGTDLTSDASMRKVWVEEAYCRVDFDGDGIAELRRIMKVGQEVLVNDEAVEVPFSSICPILIPHEHYGLSIADLTMDLQQIRSTILRQVLDNLYIQNTGRLAVGDEVELDDLLDNRIGGVIRVHGAPAANIMALPTPGLGSAAMNMMEFLEGVRENRTGVTRYNQGIDASSLNKTASGISQIMSAAQQRIQLIARIFAETGVKEMFLSIHGLLSRHQKAERVVRLRNSWAPVNPRDWKERYDMGVRVGFGTNNKDAIVQRLNNIIMMQEKAVQIGVADAQTIYNSVKELQDLSGFKDRKFFVNPSGAAQPPGMPAAPPVDPAMQQPGTPQGMGPSMGGMMPQGMDPSMMQPGMEQQPDMLQQVAQQGMQYVNELYSQIQELQQAMQGHAQQVEMDIAGRSAQAEQAIAALSTQIAAVSAENTQLTDYINKMREIDQLKAQHDSEIIGVRQEALNSKGQEIDALTAQQQAEHANLLDAISQVAGGLQQQAQITDSKVSVMLQQVEAVSEQIDAKKNVSIIYDNGKAVALSDGRKIKYDATGKLVGVVADE